MFNINAPRHLDACGDLVYQAEKNQYKRPQGSETLKIDTSKGNPSMDYAQHVDTYELFVRMTKYGTALVIVILAGMSYFLV